MVKRKTHVCNRKKCPYYNALSVKCKDCVYYRNGTWKEKR